MSSVRERGRVDTPTKRLDAQLRACLRRLAADGIWIDCGGARHRLVLDDGSDVALRAADHDIAAEAVLDAVGGPKPACLRVVDAIAAARPADLWVALTTDDRPAFGELSMVPIEHLRVLSARALRDEFADASPVVRASVSRLGLSLLAPDFRMTPSIAAKFQMTREFPHWDTGATAWADRDLVLLARCMRVSKGDTEPHLELLPAHPAARQAVAIYLIGLLDDHRLLSRADLRQALSPTFHNVRAVTALLVSEHLVVESDGGYRVAPERPRLLRRGGV